MVRRECRVARSAGRSRGRASSAARMCSVIEKSCWQAESCSSRASRCRSSRAAFPRESTSSRAFSTATAAWSAIDGEEGDLVAVGIVARAGSTRSAHRPGPRAPAGAQTRSSPSRSPRTGRAAASTPRRRAAAPCARRCTTGRRVRKASSELNSAPPAAGPPPAAGRTPRATPPAGPHRAPASGARRCPSGGSAPRPGPWSAPPHAQIASSVARSDPACGHVGGGRGEGGGAALLEPHLGDVAERHRCGRRPAVSTSVVRYSSSRSLAVAGRRRARSGSRRRPWTAPGWDRVHGRCREHRVLTQEVVGRRTEDAATRRVDVHVGTLVVEQRESVERGVRRAPRRPSGPTWTAPRGVTGSVFRTVMPAPPRGRQPPPDVHGRQAPRSGIRAKRDGVVQLGILPDRPTHS